MNQFLEEIFSQSLVLKNVYEYIKECCRDQFLKIHNYCKKEQISHFIFSGMGSSNFCAYIPYYFLTRNGISAEIRESGEFLYYSFSEKDEDYFKHKIIILISQSGESGEIVELINKIKKLKHKPKIIGLTNQSKSDLGQHSDF